LTKIRPACSDDLASFYRISLLTGDAGRDATQLYDDPQLVGHLYSAPYLLLSQETCLVVEDDQGVAGYAVGAIDTRDFENLVEAEWWPKLRHQYAAPDMADQKNWSEDEMRIQSIHFPHSTPTAITTQFPAHLHLNLLPRLQGKGMGPLLCDAWLEMAGQRGARAAHVGVNATNKRGLKFWKGCGFAAAEPNAVPPSGSAIWLGRTL
jgi:ribosomal protein S18 acetylase RimI-like enzyme